MVLVGTSRDTPGFAVDCLETWWRLDGRSRFSGATRLLVLADAGAKGCLWPASSWIVLGRAPSMASLVQNVWRRMWMFPVASQPSLELCFLHEGPELLW